MLENIEADVQAVIEFAYRGIAAVNLGTRVLDVYYAANIFGMKTLCVSRCPLLLQKHADRWIVGDLR